MRLQGEVQRIDLAAPQPRCTPLGVHGLAPARRPLACLTLTSPSARAQSASLVVLGRLSLLGRASSRASSGFHALSEAPLQKRVRFTVWHRGCPGRTAPSSSTRSPTRFPPCTSAPHCSPSQCCWQRLRSFHPRTRSAARTPPAAASPMRAPAAPTRRAARSSAARTPSAVRCNGTPSARRSRRRTAACAAWDAVFLRRAAAAHRS